ncbi:hypothetical protein LTR57_000171 [Friedmanniomyces endolithicus]|nr:hypothetical protein LTS09_001352 [Friedmanniomyces endolithicus]KAK0282592.1 hypothetical protein LTS00_012104 [Friedmanniomyces endolithicus]KAK0309875.1 hypothetical protein LTR01_004073 [Friedmanniomyces endolithicus]KAK0931952.1 hypothetical protein LTR57_000171 [Friedmanniomyces endolithicus]KAK1006853.1 hypothetical protein LTR54_006610 [Friedmanniomyces endolithicus]
MERIEGTKKWDASAYWKEQDFQTSARHVLECNRKLHLQHWIFTHQLGYLLHPKISVGEKPLKIADVACGNAAWLLDLARQHPQHEYVGLDITPAHFPAAGNLPPNIRLHVQDAFAELPSEYVGAFDIVSIRTIYSAVIDNNVEPLLSNLLKMLKPGGYLQWAENDASTLTARAPEGTGMNAMTSVASIQNFFSRHQGKMDPGWLHNLGSTLEQHGCEVLADDVIVPLPELSRAWSDNLLMVWMGLPGRLPEQAIPLPQVPGLPASLSRQSLGDLIMQSTAEASQGAWAAMDQRVVVARKAG